jgi:hypothetical protein
LIEGPLLKAVFRAGQGDEGGFSKDLEKPFGGRRRGGRGAYEGLYKQNPEDVL